MDINATRRRQCSWNAHSVPRGSIPRRRRPDPVCMWRATLDSRAHTIRRVRRVQWTCINQMQLATASRAVSVRKTLQQAKFQEQAPRHSADVWMVMVIMIFHGFIRRSLILFVSLSLTFYPKISWHMKPYTIVGLNVITWPTACNLSVTKTIKVGLTVDSIL